MIMNKIEEIENLLDMNDEEIKRLYSFWDSGDCSLVGITEIFLYQCLKNHKLDNGVHYDADYDEIQLRYGNINESKTP